ncbi:heptosyltransferase-3 [Pseudorhodoplanes sinuspersici]|nr:heptosyltransferase-3 [Pseudorhodoplanes sinuspersici]
MLQPLALPSRPRILVIALRRLGDVLLTTPLIRSMRRAWPDAHLEAMVFEDTASILEGNPDLDAVVKAPSRAKPSQGLRLAGELWRRYDLAISTQPGDRPTSFAILSGRKSVGMIDDNFNGRVKAMLLGRYARSRSDLHRVDETLQLADVIGIPRVPEIVAPRAAAPSPLQPDVPYAVVHAAPFFRYKQWHRDGWRRLAGHLLGKGLRVIATGGPGAAERAYLDGIWEGLDVVRADGALTWPELSSLMADARVFAGPDTSVTHLAAAVGCPTVALFGPTDPRRWGPWPASGLAEPWEAAGTIQRRGNVWLVQNPLPCMPCQLEGCLRHVQSHSLCLDEMPAEPVLRAVDEVLSSSKGGARGGVMAKTPLFKPSPSIAP